MLRMGVKFKEVSLSFDCFVGSEVSSRLRGCFAVKEKFLSFD